MLSTSVYQRQDSSQTLAEALEEYRRGNPDLDAPSDPQGAGAEFFRCHDAVHVVFGCGTDLVSELMADTWTLFGTTVTLRQFLSFLQLEEHRAIVSKVSCLKGFGAALRAMPAIARVVHRSRGMSRRWPWSSFEAYRDRTLADIRDEFGIEILRPPTRTAETSPA